MPAMRFPHDIKVRYPNFDILETHGSHAFCFLKSIAGLARHPEPFAMPHDRAQPREEALAAMMSEEENGGPAPELNRSYETLQVSGYPLPHRATGLTLKAGSYHFLKMSHSRERKGYTRKCEDS